MTSFWTLLRDNHNYRYAWLGQVVSEVGDHFNSIAVLDLTLKVTGSGLAVGGVMIARTLPSILAGPLSGVLLDRADRKRVMIASDLFRAVVALCFVLILTHQQRWLLYALSALLVFASPFFTSGRSAILPRITTPQELHTANSLTQTTAWVTLTVGTMLGGISTMKFGYQWAFVANAASFVFSAWAIWKLRSKQGHFRPLRDDLQRHQWADLWKDYADGIRFMRATPLIAGIAIAYMGWASGGGAAQVLFTLFGEVVFKAGASGIGLIWGSAGVGLVLGGILAHRLAPRLDFAQYKNAVSCFYFLHGVSYILFALMPTMAGSIFFIVLSRLGMGANNVMNRSMLLTHVPDRFRGRVFSTLDMIINTTMTVSLALAGLASRAFDAREIGVAAGVLSAATTTLFWTAANLLGRLPEPQPDFSQAGQDFPSKVTPA